MISRIKLICNHPTCNVSEDECEHRKPHDWQDCEETTCGGRSVKCIHVKCKMINVILGDGEVIHDTINDTEEVK